MWIPHWWWIFTRDWKSRFSWCGHLRTAMLERSFNFVVPWFTCLLSYRTSQTLELVCSLNALWSLLRDNIYMWCAVCSDKFHAVIRVWIVQEWHRYLLWEPVCYLRAEIKNFLYSNWIHAFCLNLLTICSLVLKRWNLNKLFKSRKAHPKHNFLFLLCLLKLETSACQQSLATDRSLKLILTDSNRGVRKVEWKSVYTFSVEMHGCSKTTKVVWQKIHQYVFSEWKDNVSVYFQLEYQVSWFINHNFFAFLFFSELIYFLLSLLLLSVSKEKLWYESSYWPRK